MRHEMSSRSRKQRPRMSSRGTKQRPRKVEAELHNASQGSVEKELRNSQSKHVRQLTRGGFWGWTHRQCARCPRTKSCHLTTLRWRKNPCEWIPLASSPTEDTWLENTSVARFLLVHLDNLVLHVSHLPDTKVTSTMKPSAGQKLKTYLRVYSESLPRKHLRGRTIINTF